MTGQTVHFPIALGTKVWDAPGDPYTVVSLMANDRGQHLMIIERGTQSRVVDMRLIGTQVFLTREEANAV